MMSELGKLLMIFGAVVLVVGAALQYGVSIPWLRWIGKLPGDVHVSFSNFRLLLPLGSCLVISVVLSVLLHLVGRR